MRQLRIFTVLLLGTEVHADVPEEHSLQTGKESKSNEGETSGFGGLNMHPPELITQWRKCFGCGGEIPLSSDTRKPDGFEVRFCPFCGQILIGVYAHG
jgi:hypothetical protein